MLNPSDLDLGSLPWLPLEARSAFPRHPAIYFAITSDAQVQYIGRSIDPKRRWKAHHRYSELSEMSGVRIAYLFADADLLPVIEAALIDWFKPPLNSVRVENAAAEESCMGWNVDKIMLRLAVSNVELGELLERHPTSVCRLRRAVTMPRMDGSDLLLLLNALNKISRSRGMSEIITPADLFDWTPPAMNTSKNDRSIEAIALTKT